MPLDTHALSMLHFFHHQKQRRNKMGKYIQGPHLGKAKMLLDQHHGKLTLNPPTNFNDIPDGKALIVVVDNGPFEAAAHLDNEREFNYWMKLSINNDPRPRTYILLDKILAEQLAK